MTFYGIDPGLKHLAVVKLSTLDDTFTIDDMRIINVSEGMENFYKHYSQNMLENGDAYVEYQFRNGKTKNHSHHIHGYLTAMMNGKRVELKQPRDKFRVAEELGIMPEHGDLRVYKNRKKCAEHILAHVLEKTDSKHITKNQKKMDDLADALLYALWAIRERSPMSLQAIANVNVGKLEAIPEHRKIKLTI